MRTALFLIAALIGGSAFAADKKTGSPQAESGKEKIICKRELETGSLVKTKKICLTARDWTLMREESDRAYESMNRRMGGERGN